MAHLGKIASLELEVGSPDAAKAAAETLVRRHPGDLDGYRLRSEIAFRLGDTREALDWLQRAVRVAVRDVPIRLELAAAVAKYGTADEAAEHYWRCFELAEHFDDKRTIIANLAELAKANGTQDRFLDRLRRLRSTQEDSKSLTLCLVDALRDLGNPSEARFELEKLAGSRPDDLDLLKMLAALGAERNDWAAAIAYQERVVALAPESHHIEDLARYHRVKGNVAAAEETLLRLVDTGDRDAFVSAIAHAIDQLAFPDAKRLAAAGLSRRPDDWRILFLAGTAQLATGDSRAAERSFEAVLSSPAEVTPVTPWSKSESPTRSHSSSSTKRPRASSLLRPTGSAVRKTRVNQQVQVALRPQNPLDDVPAGKLADLDEIRDALAHWLKLESMATMAPHSPAPPQPRMQLQAGAVNSQVVQGLRSRWRQAQVQLQQGSRRKTRNWRSRLLIKSTGSRRRWSSSKISRRPRSPVARLVHHSTQARGSWSRISERRDFGV